MASGLYSGVSGLALGTGLYKGVSGLWSGASGLVTGYGGGSPYDGASLYLDFLTMTAPTFDSRITFTRGSNATLTDSTGKVTYAPANLLLQSQTFDNASWTKSGTSVVTGAQANPVDGLVNAQKMVENTAAGNHRVQQSFTSATGVTYTFSCYAKAAERTWVYLYDDISNAFAYFNLAAGTVGTVGAGWTSTSITSVGSGWYRISATATEAAGGGGNQLIGLASANGTSSYTGDGTSGIYVWGAQLEPVTYQTTPGTYQATTSSAYYGPRFDYDPVTLAAKGLLIEEARTNLLKQSADFTSAEWIVTGVASRTNNNIAPDGSTTGCTVVEDTAASGHWVLTAGTNRPTPGNVATTASVYLKAGTRRYVNVSFENSGNGYNATVDTVGWTITQQGLTGVGWANGSAVLISAGNGWYRLAITATPPAATTASVFIAGAPASSSIRQASYTGDGSTWVIWGAQLEAGAFATSYIPTVASTVTRSADVATMTGTNFSSWFNASAGTMVAVYDQTTVATDIRHHVWCVSDAGNNRLALRASDSAINYPISAIGTGAAVVSLAGTAATSNTVVKIATAYGSNMAQSQNGATPVTDANAASVVGSSIALGNNNSSGAYLNGHIRELAYFNSRQANATLQTLTAPSTVPSLTLDFTSGSYSVGY